MNNSIADADLLYLHLRNKSVFGGNSFMKVKCVWEHNGDDSILYASNFIGAFTRGKSKCEAIEKMSSISAYLKWKGALT